LRPTNDYKTSVLSGLSPAVILEICGRAIAFWQYQIHQEGSYQQAVLKSLNDKNSQISKQLENVVREANGELNLLNNKLAGLEHELELERRKARDAQASSREKDKEYQKLKNQFDKVKCKALLGPSNLPQVGTDGTGFSASCDHHNERISQTRTALGGNSSSLQAAENMDLNSIQRTPIKQRMLKNPSWNQQHRRMQSHRSTLGAGSISEHSEAEVDSMFAQQRQSHGIKPVNVSAIQTGYSRDQRHQRVLHTPAMKHTSGGFRPAGFGQR